MRRGAADCACVNAFLSGAHDAELASLRGEVAFLGGHLQQLVEVVQALADRQGLTLQQTQALADTVRGHTETLDYLRARARAQAGALRSARHDIEELRVRLAELRTGSEYAAVWDDPDPLVSVVIPTYNRPRQLVEVAIASVLAQTHQRVEVIAVSDGPSAENRAAVEGIGDPRVIYRELSVRTVYPREPVNRWFVTGTRPMIEGLRAATGTWVAWLGDDDAFTPDHVERLLEVARSERAEWAYGAIKYHNVSAGFEDIVYSNPPQYGRIGLQSGLFLKSLDFIDFDPESWQVDEPNDWEYLQRLLEVGVRYASTTDIVGTVWAVPYEEKYA